MLSPIDIQLLRMYISNKTANAGSVWSNQPAIILCLAAAGDYIVVLPGKDKDFIKTLADMGYIVPQFREQT